MSKKDENGSLDDIDDWGDADEVLVDDSVTDGSTASGDDGLGAGLGDDDPFGVTASDDLDTDLGGDDLDDEFNDSLGDDPGDDLDDDFDDQDDDFDGDPPIAGDRKNNADNGAGKKPSKLKLYGLIAGMGVFVVGILGTGFILTSGPGQSSGPPAGYAQEPAPMVAQAQSAEPPMATEPVQAEPVRRAPISAGASLDLDTSARIQERPMDWGGAAGSGAQQAWPDQAIPSGFDPSQAVQASLSSVPPNVVEDLSDKADMLAEALTKFKSDTQSSLDPLASDMSKAQGRIDKHEERLDAIEAQLKQIAASIEAMKPAPKPKPKPRPKPVAKSSAKPSGASSARAPAPTSPIAGYQVVATYPSTLSKGVSPQKAWITNGERLVQVVVGTMVDGAKVTGISGTTVHTNRGSIRAPK